MSERIKQWWIRHPEATASGITKAAWDELDAAIREDELARHSERGERNEALVVWTPERLEQFRSAPPCEKHFSPSWHDDKRLDHWVDCDGCLREAFHAGTVAAEWGSHRIEKLRKAARLIANLDSTLALTVGAAADYFASSPLLRGAPEHET